MRRTVSIKIAVLLPVVFLTHFLTSEIMPHYIVANEKPAGGPTLTKIAVDPANPPAGFTRPTQLNKHIVSSGTLRASSIEVQDAAVKVASSVDLSNSRDDTVYLWRLRALRESDGVAQVDQPYLKQVFTMHPSGRMNPTFSDVLQLPAGRYRILLSLYGVPKGYDFKRLNDEQVAQAQMLIQIPKDIEIQ